MLITTKQKRNILEDTNLNLELSISESELEVSKKRNTLEYKLTVPWIGKNKLRLFLPRSQGLLVF